MGNWYSSEELGDMTPEQFKEADDKLKAMRENKEVRYPIGYIDEIKKEINDLTYWGNHDEPYYKDRSKSAP